ncbi:8274_t:CDS:1, partial [Racocetra persica]
LREDIEAFHFRNIMDLEKFINYPEEKETHEMLGDQEIVNLATNLEPEENQSDNDDNSTEIRQVIHNEALNTIDLLDQYLLQQDLCDTDR